MNLYELYDERIRPAVYEQLDSVFPEFGWKKTKVGWVASNREITKRLFGVRPDRVICTQGKTRTQIPAGFFVLGTDAHLLFTEYLNNGMKPTGEEFREIVADLARRVNVPVELSAAAKEQDRLRRERLEAEKERAAKAHRDMDPSVLKYWHSRSLGVAPPQDIGSDGGWLYAAVRDTRGQIVGSFKRSLDPNARGSEKYQYSEGLDWDQVVAINMAPARETKTARFVEGVLEPFVMHAHGLEVQSVGGTLSKLTPERWLRVIKFGVETVYLFYDNDAEGLKGARKALENLRSLDQDKLTDVRVIRRGDFAGCKDAGEMLTKYSGVIEINTAFANSVNHFEWSAQELIDYCRGDGWTANGLSKCIRMATDFMRQVKPKQIPYALQIFQGHLEKHVPDYERCRQQIDDRIAKEREEQAYAADVRRCLESIRDVLDGTVEGGVEALAGLAEDVERLSTANAPRPSTRDLLRSHRESIKKYRGRKDRIIGLAQQTIPALDAATCGLRGFCLLAAPPNVGKTSLSWQWGIDILCSNPKAGFALLSLEMDKEDMLTRAMCNIAKIEYRDYIFGPIGRDFTFHEEMRIEGAFKKLDELAPRLLILDKDDVYDKRARVIRRDILQWKEENELEMVYTVLDFLQKMRPPEAVRRALRSGEEVEEWRIDECFKLRLSKEEPLVVISAVRKANTDKTGIWQQALDMVKGSGQNTYSPEMVFFSLLAEDEQLREWLNGKGQDVNPKRGQEYEKEMKKWQDRLKQSGRRFVNFTIAKGRDGVEQVTIPLTFYFRENKFKEGWEWDELWKNTDQRPDDAASAASGREVPGPDSSVA